MISIPKERNIKNKINDSNLQQKHHDNKMLEMRLLVYILTVIGAKIKHFLLRLGGRRRFSVMLYYYLHIKINYI